VTDSWVFGESCVEDDNGILQFRILGRRAARKDESIIILSYVVEVLFTVYGGGCR
jgi:hypothetical protein